MTARYRRGRTPTASAPASEPVSEAAGSPGISPGAGPRISLLMAGPDPFGKVESFWWPDAVVAYAFDTLAADCGPLAARAGLEVQ
jgi:hypothetical protein